MVRGRKAGRSLFECTHKAYVAGASPKLVYTKRIETKKCVVSETVCKRSAHKATFKRSFCPASWRTNSNHLIGGQMLSLNVIKMLSQKLQKRLVRFHSYLSTCHPLVLRLILCKWNFLALLYRTQVSVDELRFVEKRQFSVIDSTSCTFA